MEENKDPQWEKDLTMEGVINLAENMKEALSLMEKLYKEKRATLIAAKLKMERDND